MRKVLYIAILLLAVLACEKMTVGTEEGTEEQGNVVLHFSAFQTDMQTRAIQPVSSVFSKLAIMMFDSEGNKVFSKTKTQSNDEDNFGTVVLSTGEGTYTLIAVGHSGYNTPSIALDKVSFTTKDGLRNTDTFYYYGTITVSNDVEHHDLVMIRATAMFRLQLSDETLPAGVTKLHFKTTGGSADFNPQDGLGCTNSTQEEDRAVTSNSRVFEVFTFPKSVSGSKVKIIVTALDANDNVLKTRTFIDVPVKANYITTYTGNFFDGTETNVTQSGLGFTADPDWAGNNEYEF